MESLRRTSSVLDDATRRVAVTAAAGAAIGWWPAFTLGAYGVVFFEEQFRLWAVATAVFLIACVTYRWQVLRRPALWALTLPSLWLLGAWLLPPGGTTAAHQALFWFGAAVTILGVPTMAALIVRLLLPGAELLSGRAAASAVCASARSCSASATESRASTAAWPASSVSWRGSVKS